MKEQSRYLRRFEPIPSSVIAEVIPNYELLKNTPDRRLREYVYKDRIIEKAGFFALSTPSSDAGEMSPLYHYQSPFMHRGFVVEFPDELPFVDEYGVRYGQIIAKGTGTTDTSEKPLIHSDPWGFFGDRHAFLDTDVSNTFAAAGGRTSRSLATLVLDPEKFREWSMQWPYKDTNKYRAETHLDRVLGNEDNPVIYLRLMGADRQDEANHATIRLYSDLNRPYNKAEIYKRAMKLLGVEIEGRGGLEKFQDTYSMPDTVASRIKKAFDTQEFENVLDALHYTQAFFFQWNLGIGEVLRTQVYNDDLHFNLHTGNYDLLGMWVDWENSREVSGQVMNSIHYPMPYKVNKNSIEDHEQNILLGKSRRAGKMHAERALTLPSL